MTAAEILLTLTHALLEPFFVLPCGRLQPMFGGMMRGVQGTGKTPRIDPWTLQLMYVFTGQCAWARSRKSHHGIMEL